MLVARLRGKHVTFCCESEASTPSSQFLLLPGLGAVTRRGRRLQDVLAWLPVSSQERVDTGKQKAKEV